MRSKLKLRRPSLKNRNKRLEKFMRLLKTKKNQEKLVNKTFDNIDIAARTEWMRLIFEERNTPAKTD